MIPFLILNKLVLAIYYLFDKIVVTYANERSILMKKEKVLKNISDTGSFVTDSPRL